MELQAKKVVMHARNAFNSGITRPIQFRKKQLLSLYKMLESNVESFVEALGKDLRKPRQECLTMEVDYVLNDILMMLHNLDKWASPQSVPKNLVLLLDTPYIMSEPYGVVLIISPWNYPLQLALGPMVGAIAAGNAVVLKPSEISPATSDLLHTLLPKYLDTDCFHVFQGGPEQTTELLREKFDYIFFTGSPSIGQIIYKAAAQSLTPVTLELGGKCPAIICGDADLPVSCRRLLWGKFVNSGQTCIAPDYVLTTTTMLNSVVDQLRQVIFEFYGSDPKTSPDFGRIISTRHTRRLSEILSKTKGRIAIGGQVDIEDCYVAPTVLTEVTMDDASMKEEIFGPILPIIAVKNMDEAIELINDGEKPLSLYVFSKSSKTVDKIVSSTSSGSVCVNDTVVHLSIFELPFGGVGMSGIGKYHGEASFNTFSHKKSVLHRGFNPMGEFLGKGRYPPYSDKKAKTLGLLLKRRKSYIPSYAGSIFWFLLGVLFFFVIQVILDQFEIKIFP